jgi:hypothetical protein
MSYSIQKKKNTGKERNKKKEIYLNLKISYRESDAPPPHTLANSGFSTLTKATFVP